MPRPKYVKIEKKVEDYICGLPHIVGLHVLRLMKQGYHKFEIYEENEYIVIRALRRLKKKQEAKETSKDESN